MKHALAASVPWVEPTTTDADWDEAKQGPPSAMVAAEGLVYGPAHSSTGQESGSVAQDGALSAATEMTVTLSMDHRVLDGVTGARGLAEFIRVIEHPVELVLPLRPSVAT